MQINRTAVLSDCVQDGLEMLVWQGDAGQTGPAGAKGPKGEKGDIGLPGRRVSVRCAEFAQLVMCKYQCSVSSGTWYGWAIRKARPEPYIVRRFAGYPRTGGAAQEVHLATDHGSRPPAAQSRSELSLATRSGPRTMEATIVETATLQPGARPR